MITRGHQMLRGPGLSPAHCLDQPHCFALVAAPKCRLFRVFNFQTLIKMVCVSPGNSVKLTTTEVKADYVATHPDMVNQFSHTKCLLVN